MSFFYNAVSFISGLFFTKKAESDFDDLYLNQDDPIGNLAPLVPSKVEPAAAPPAAEAAEATMTTDAAPPAGPPGVFFVVVPAAGPVAEPSGVVLVDIPPAAGPVEEPASVATMTNDAAPDLLRIQQNSITPPTRQKPNLLTDAVDVPITTNADDVILCANAIKKYYPDWATTQIKKNITTCKNNYYKDISEINFCVEIVDDNDSEASYDYTLQTNIKDELDEDIKLGFINISNLNVTIEPNKFVNYLSEGALIPVNITEKTIVISSSNVVRVNINNDHTNQMPQQVNFVEKMVRALQKLNECINNQNTFQEISDSSFETLFFGQTSEDISNISPYSGGSTTYGTYFNTNMKSKSTNNNKISQKLTLVMSYKKVYLYDNGKNLETLTLEQYNNDNDYNEYTISFSYAITSEKKQKKTLVTQTMVETIVPKLNASNCVKGLFGPPTLLPDIFKYVLLQPKDSDDPNNKTTLQIYTPNELNSLVWTEFTIKLTQLQNKPRTLLTHDSLNTYLNILIAMLDKPHDIIGGRVSEEAQKNGLKNISENIVEYIKYLRVIINANNVITKINGENFNDTNKTDKINKFKDFLRLVRSMIPKFTQSIPSKYINPHVIYENAIMLSVQQILKEVEVTGVGVALATDMGNNFPALPAPPAAPPAVMGNDNVVINPDVMYLTTEITSRVNQPGTTTRKYFSAPEVIDHGHIYNIDGNTNIQFPENYKQIQLRDPFTPNFFTIHSYSETTNEPQLDPVTSTNTNTLYYNVYVWFTENDVTTPPKCMIKYKTPFIYAPDCARVYAGYRNIVSNIIGDTTGYEVIKNAFNEIAASFTNLSVEMRKLIPYLMIDQFYNAKSLQDDQNQLQVNQRTTIPPAPATNPNEIPTRFLGLCCDLTSAANGFNYYMSQPQANRNPNSIVGYYYSTKKIWVTNLNQIKIQITTAPTKTASKNILDILQDIINPLPYLGGAVVGGNKRKMNLPESRDRDWQSESRNWLESGQESNKRYKLESGQESTGNVTPVREKWTPPNNKGNKRRLDFNDEGRGANLNQKEEAKKKAEKAKEEANAITLSYYCDPTKWEDDNTKTEEYGQYVYYNTMADWLYLDDNFETYKKLLFKQVKYVMTGTKYDVIGTEYLSSNYFFDILSIDFIEKMIKMLNKSKPLIDLMIKNNERDILKKIIAQCAIYILTKIELKPDNIYPPDEQIKRSNDLDARYDKVINNINKFINQENNNPQVEGDFGDNVIDVKDLGGGFSKKRKFRKNTNKKRTIRKKTNKKRTIRKKTNKKRTIRKKIRHTIFKTKKNHK
jgi:hypothetical protein